MRLLKTALVQTHCTADASDNRQRMAAYVREAAAAGAKLVVLQELHNTPYFRPLSFTAAWHVSAL